MRSNILSFYLFILLIILLQAFYFPLRIDAHSKS